MKAIQLVNALRNGNAPEVNAILGDRKAITQQELKELIKPMRAEGIYIDEDDMGQATWYYLWKKVNVKSPTSWERENLASQFYWNEGEYNANGVHSLFDEWGTELVK
tara:strand:+ start:1993 stop:2313 length:321 start_codon:yes stop_codon:yes gene_type:complete